jgi:NAD(P)H dehydrogenase (quinone)
VNIFIVYTHPSEDSFTRHVRDEFIKGLLAAGHSYEISDLYKMKFQSDISEEEYLREANYRVDLPLNTDILNEHKKINNCDAIVFIYPVFWTEAPSKLVGWFDRVWTYGFAYGERHMKRIDKAIVICVAGHSMENLAKYGHLDSMKTVMLGDRLFDRVDKKEMIIFDCMAKCNMNLRNSNWDVHLKKAFNLGLYI